MINNEDDNTINKLNAMNKDLQNKLIVLKNALLEERKKTSNLDNQIKELNEQIYEKDSIILNYKTENKTLNDTLSKYNPKEYFKKMLGEDSEEMKNESDNQKSENLKLENDKLNQELKDFQEQNLILKEKLELLTTEIDNIKKQSNLEIEKLKKELQTEKKNLEQEKERYNIIEGLSQQFNSEKTLYENKISSLKISNEELNGKINNLENINNELKKKNEIYGNTMSELKKQIENMGNENLVLKKKLEEPEEIKEDYMFIGSIYDNDETRNDKKIMIYFGKFVDKIELTFENGSFDFPIQKIITMKKINNKEGYILLKLFDNKDEEKKFICQFSEKECEYILKFYNNMKKSFEDNKEQVRLNNYNLDSFSFLKFIFILYKKIK